MSAIIGTTIIVDYIETRALYVEHNGKLNLIHEVEHIAI